MNNFSKHALEGKYTDFKNSIVAEMARRMNTHPIINEYNRQMDYYNNLSKYMKEIPTINEYQKG